MKKALLFLTALVIGFAGCKKDENNYYGPYTPPYHIEGLRDISFQKRVNGALNSNWLSLSVIYENSDQEKITLSLEGIPAGISYILSDSSGYPSFGSSVTFTDSAAAVGNYTAKLVVRGAITGRREYPFSIHVLPAVGCNNNMAGTGFNTQNSCSSAGMYVQDVVPVSGSLNEVLFTNFDGNGSQVKAVIDCDNSSPFSGSFTIPSQTVNGVTYSANFGRYSTGSNGLILTFSYTATTGSGGTSNCSMRLSK